MKPMLRRSAVDQTPCWRLWVDRCGGYGLFVADQVSLGAARPDGVADIQVRADWRREEGRLVRRGADYFWRPESGRATGGGDADVLIRPGQSLPISGSANVRLEKPSPLSASALLKLDPPHRFDGHVDAVLLVERTLLIGPQGSDHIRCCGIESSAVLVLRPGGWQARLQPTAASDAAAGGAWCDVVPGRRISLGDLDMMLETV